MTSQDILTRLTQMGAPFEHYTHQPIFSAGERYSQNLHFGATVCKNLLVTTRNENRFLLIMLPLEKDADLKALRSAVQSTRLGFAGEQTLFRLLGQTKGSVGVCGIINDKSRIIEVVFDLSLRDKTRIAMHPNDNSQTVVMSFDTLYKYVREWGSKIIFFDF